MENAETRTRFFGMTVQQRDAFMAREDVKDFLTRYREMAAQQRTVTGAELNIATVLVDLLRENVEKYSRMISRVNFKALKGKSRQTVMGVIPEAVWTEAVGALNELDLSFSQLEFDGYKVGGYFSVPNSTLEDTDDISLLTELLDSMGVAIGKAVDRTIVYGDGVKKPVGYITRLAAESEPSWWGTDQAPFTDLHESHVLTIDAGAKSGAAFFAELISKLAIASPKYSLSGVPTWNMNRKTHMDILSKALAFDASAALVAGVNNTMPVVGGEIVELECMPDYEIGGGYMDCYSLRERAGVHVKYSDIPLMLKDQTVLVGTQRMDGKPSVGEAFVLVNYANSAATTSQTFPEDVANDEAATAAAKAAATTPAPTAAKTVSKTVAKTANKA